MNQKLKKSNSISADILLHNGVFITMDPARPEATALAIKNTLILWVGDQNEMDDWKGQGTRTIDLKGCCVYPGFIDTHMHVLYTGLVKSYLQLQECLDKSTIISKVKEYVKICQKDEWIFGIGWDDHHWSKKTVLHAADLDAVAPHHPVVLRRSDTHLIWVNSLVLKLAGIDAKTTEPAGGKIERDPAGNPTGILIDSAMGMVHDVIPICSFQQRVQIIQNTLEDCLQKGITTVHNASTDESDFQSFKQLASENRLKVRIYLMGAVRHKEDIQLWKGSPQTYSPFLQQCCLKLWMDGALGSRGAALFEPYEDDGNNCGHLLWEKEDLLPILQQAKFKGFQVAIHAIGDRAIQCVLDAYEKLGVKGLRWRIEHAQQIAHADIKRFAELEVIAAMQPLHATADMAWIKERLGKKRIESGAFMWRSLLDSGAMIVGGSDAPVVDANPLWGIYAAITRQDHHQFPEKGWYPKQKVTREEALKIYTIDAAYACFRENELGSLTPGKLADLVVLPENLLTCEPKAMLNMKVIYTIVNGKIVFERNG